MQAAAATAGLPGFEVPSVIDTTSKPHSGALAQMAVMAGVAVASAV